MTQMRARTKQELRISHKIHHLHKLKICIVLFVGCERNSIMAGCFSQIRISAVMVFPAIFIAVTIKPTETEFSLAAFTGSDIFFPQYFTHKLHPIECFVFVVYDHWYLPSFDLNALLCLVVISSSIGILHRR